MKNKPHIALIGLKGSGKSTVGKYLSHQLSRPFIDTDRLIEEDYFQKHQQRLSCAHIFNILGKKTFADMEFIATSSILCSKDPLVIATGGSSMLNDDLATSIKPHAWLCMLNASSNTLFQRWQQAPPNFCDQSQDLKPQLLHYYHQRASYYLAMADISIHVDEKKVEQICEEIRQILSGK